MFMVIIIITEIKYEFKALYRDNDSLSIACVAQLTPGGDSLVVSYAN